jgi:hypothetical protein
VTAKHIAVKKYVVRLSDEERERLNTLIHRGKHRAGQLVKARILQIPTQGGQVFRPDRGRPTDLMAASIPI